jgi:hypothetical protein
MSTPKPLTQAQMREATGLGAEWQLIWAGPDPFAENEHLCTGLYGPGGTYRSEWVRVRYEPTGTAGVQAAKCERCKIAWVRAAAG